MRPVLTPYAPVRSQVHFVPRVAEGLAVLAACVYFLASRSQRNDDALPAYALSAVAGLVLTPVLLALRLVPRSLSILGIIGYALLLAGVVCNLLGIADIGWHVSPAALVFLAPVACSSSCSRPC
jgi:multidrug transporter EmrE-like cation transporter